MKRLNLMILIIGVAIIFFGCSKNNSLAPDLNQSDELTSSLKAKKVHTFFTGETTPIIPPPSGGNDWSDVADDSRVTGVGTWVTEGGPTADGKLWGTTELTVDDGSGKWEMKWYGTQTLTIDGFNIVAYAVGVGTEGNVKGMFGEWTYTMNYTGGFPVNPFHESFFYVTEGYIAPKQMTKTIKFFEATGPIEFDYTVGGCTPYPYETVTGEGNASHIGHYTVLNTGCFDGSLISGKITAANGDEIHTYIAYAVNVDGIWYFHYIVNGGTGRFDCVSGYIDMYGTIDLVFEGDPPHPISGTWTLEGEGVIVY